MCDLLQFVKRNRYILQSTRLPDEEQDSITVRHAPKFLMHLWSMAEEIVYSTLSYDLHKEDGKSTNIPTEKHLKEFYSTFKVKIKVLFDEI